jgi:pimeloyl-ACP methyl ester carboxylesterase
VDVIGCSFGGWVAAELASMVPHRIRALVLVAPCGVKTNEAHLPDLFALPPAEVEAMLWHDPARFRRDPASLTEDEARIVQRNRESFLRFGRDPYLYNPKLPHRLHRAVCPTLFLRGAHDALIQADYTERYADLFPDARIVTIPEAGHLPQIEQPALFTDIVLAFLRGEG